MTTYLRNSYPYRFFKFLGDYAAWVTNKYSAPSPNFIKQACLIRNSIPNATWIETGTFLGQTTELLSKNASKVYSIEPEPTLFANAKKHFSGYKNVSILNGTSEDVFPGLLPKIKGDVNFWLDGHYSAGITFKGPQSTPIIDELRNISENLINFNKICILVDDVRCFNLNIPEFSAYPSIELLVDFARSHKLNWHIEHDIFIAKNWV
ncbi:MAG: hypothetical protein HKK67_11225 [Chlorobiaceae bacterium]|nr:hypothetical protein [Chlorobiaceae bacterium]